MHQLWRETVHAARRLRAAPVFTTFAIVTLALGIGTTTAVYSVVDATVLRPPAMRDIERVASLYHMDPRRGGSGPMISLSLPDFEDYRAAQRSFTALAPWTRFRHALTGPAGGEVLLGEAVGGDYFAVVGVEAALGRVLQRADAQPGAPRVIVLSDGLWRRQFAADPHVVGKTVNLGGRPAEIVGVAPAWFKGIDMPNVMATPAWIPFAVSESPDRHDIHDREQRWVRAIGRLAPERTMAEAQAEFQAFGKALDAAHPIGRGETRASRYATSRPWFLLPRGDIRMHESMHAIVGPLATTILIAILLVLLVACTNLANLMLARGTARRHEFAVRLALGASRWRLAREQLVEAVLITIAGGIGAFVVARVVMVRLLSARFDVGPGMAVEVAPELNTSVAAVAIGAMALSLLVFGLTPALQAMRASVRDALSSDGHNAPAPRWRGRRVLIALQVSVSAGLIAVAVLCAQQLLAQARHDTGIDLERLALARIDFALEGKQEAQVRPLLDRLLNEARLQPGAGAVALASGLPVGTGSRWASFAAEVAMDDGFLKGRGVSLMAAGPGLLEVLGVPLVAGRDLAASDRATSERVVVLDEATARQLFGSSTAAVGRIVHFQPPRFVGEAEQPVRTATIVGVSAATDVGVVGRRNIGGLAYVPFTQEYDASMSVIVRTAGDPAPMAEQLRRTITRLEPGLATLQSGTGIKLGGAENPVLRIGAASASALGALALALAMAGLYGVLADSVGRRTREIGLRLALGAERSRVVRMVLRDGLMPVAGGLLAGLALGGLVRLSFRPLFLRLMPAFDPWMLVIVPIPFLFAALLAAYLPARRAARVDPNVALRHL